MNLLAERLARTTEAMNTAFRALYLEVAPEIVDDLRHRFNDYLQAQLEAQGNREKLERKGLRDEALEEAARKCSKLYNTLGWELADEIRGMKSGS